MPVESQLFQWYKTINRARSIADTLGTRRAAGYLRNRKVPLEAALTILGFPVRQG